MDSRLEGHATRLLGRAGDGDAAAAEELLPLVYAELRALAQAHLVRERPDHTLQATALVHEAYLRLVDGTEVRPRDRAHFLALAAQAIRRILVDHARGKGRQKRGGGRAKVGLSQAGPPAEDRNVDLLDLDDALARLAEVNERYVRVVEMRFFGGCTNEQIADLLDVSISTVERDWRIARAWLFRELEP